MLWVDHVIVIQIIVEHVIRIQIDQILDQIQTVIVIDQEITKILVCANHTPSLKSHFLNEYRFE